MNHKNQKLTKQVEREAMLGLLREREGRTPDHMNPHWVHHFWRQRIMGNDEIRRILSVGMATMSEHLKYYKDPFEPSEDENQEISIEIGHYALLHSPFPEANASLENDPVARNRPAASEEQSNPRRV